MFATAQAELASAISLVKRVSKTKLSELQYSTEVEVELKGKKSIAHAWLLEDAFAYEESSEHTILVSKTQRAVLPRDAERYARFRPAFLTREDSDVLGGKRFGTADHKLHLDPRSSCLLLKRQVFEEFNARLYESIKACSVEKNGDIHCDADPVERCRNYIPEPTTSDTSARSHPSGQDPADAPGGLSEYRDNVNRKAMDYFEYKF